MCMDKRHQPRYNNGLMPEQFDYLTVNDARTLLRAVDDVRDRAVITMILTTGLFVNELIELSPNAIDFDSRTLSATGSRARTIPLNDQAHDALAQWTQTRLDTTCQNLFVTQKGTVQSLSVRSIDKLIHKYSKQAGFKRKINAKILRNTFAVNLFSDSGMTIKQAGDILGITDYDSIKRYQTAAQCPDSNQPLPDLKQTDTRSTASKLIGKLLPTAPKKIKATDTGAAAPIDTASIIIGRDTVMRDIEACLARKQSTLISGPLGIGKTHVMTHIMKKTGNTVFISLPLSLKDMLKKICDAIDPAWQDKLGSRAATKDILQFATETTQPNMPVIVIDNLHKLRIADLEAMLGLLENYTILAAADELTPKLKQLWWKFHKIELNPLTEDTMRALIKALTQHLSISDYELMETQLLNYANGMPLAVTDMVRQLSYKNVVSRNAVRELSHEVGVTYRDWSFALIVLWGLVVMSRFIALGTHSFEGYILAGMGTSVLVVARFFLLRMR